MVTIRNMGHFQNYTYELDEYPILVGLCGSAGVGKSTIADRLVKQHHFSRMPFGFALKQVCEYLFDFSEEQLYGDKKEEIDERYDFSPRYAMQYLGTDVFRTMCPNIWIDCLKRRYVACKDQMDPITRVVIDDVRFPNEVDFIHEWGGIVIKIVSPDASEILSADRRIHASEATLGGYDFVVPNAHSVHITHPVGAIHNLIQSHYGERWWGTK